jgi:hypothetical protein
MSWLPMPCGPAATLTDHLVWDSFLGCHQQAGGGALGRDDTGADRNVD